MKKEFEQELQETLYVHRPLPLHPERSLEASFPKKKVEAQRILYSAGERIADPVADREGTLSEENGTLVLSASLRSDHWPEGVPADGDYTNFGSATIRFSFPPQDWSGYNRIRFWVRPHMTNARIVSQYAALRNVGKTPIPDPYYREGSTAFDLKNGEWNECIWEFAVMPRDAIDELRLFVGLSGHDVAAGETMTYEYKDLRLERVEHPEHERGWQRNDNAILFSTVGYWQNSRKTAVTGAAVKSFELIAAESGEAVFAAPAKPVKNDRGEFALLDFSDFCTAGSYRIRTEFATSEPFEIGQDLCRESLWKVLNYIYCERCGTPVPGKHGTCHQDITAFHNGVTMSFCGGWHDAGDVSQQAAQSAEVVHALFENASRCKEDMPLYLRLMEEAQWGLDFILRTRFGDGFRATSAGATRFTDNLMGNFDDIPARVHDHAYENFLFSGVEAYASHCLQGYDDELAAGALLAAKEDFGFAVKKFAETGVDPAPSFFEHTYNSGRSQYYAAAAWAASCLVEAGSAGHAEAARQYGDLLLLCQETGNGGAPLTGFFYRDESHKTIVHFNHQAREQQFIQALEALCRTQPQAQERPRWEQAMRLYGHYLKAISGNTAPFDMLPAGIHKTDEVFDSELFPYLHLTCRYEDEVENYKEQLANGTQLSEGYVLRNFPVWFSFRGNSAVLLSMGKAASLLGRYFHDEELLQLGREQLYWLWGKNPFGQSLIYGAGSNYCRQYAVLCGECTGEVPVGIETLNNEDEPYWPQNNNATYREVWIGAACRWLWLCADFLED